MIIVVEGVSAAGKTTWASRYASALIEEVSGLPPQSANPVVIGQYWSNKQSERWLRAIHLEQTHDTVCLDTDPLKIHYAWCLWQIGQGTREAWISTVQASREHVARQELGFADQIIYLEPAKEVVQAQKVADIARRRGNFETHLRLYEPLRHWYEMLENLSPGRLHINPEQPQPTPSRRSDRYDLKLFDELIQKADQAPE